MGRALEMGSGLATCVAKPTIWQKIVGASPQKERAKERTVRSRAKARLHPRGVHHRPHVSKVGATTVAKRATRPKIVGAREVEKAKMQKGTLEV